MPLYYKQVNELCAGVQIHVTDKRAVRPVELGVKLVRTIQALYPREFRFNEPAAGARWRIDLLSGTDELRRSDMTADEILDGWAREAGAFEQVRARYALYGG